MAAVHHDVGADIRCTELRLAAGDIFSVKVRLAVAATQYDMPVFVACGFHHGNTSPGIDAEEAVRVAHRFQCIDGDAEAAIGAVFETDGTGQPAGHDAMCLRLGGACTDSRPGNQVLQVLW